MIKRALHPSESPRLLSLFAGAGGLDLGLEKAGYVTLLANDFEAHACRSLEANQLLPNLDASGFADWFEKQLTQRCYKRASEDEVRTLRSRVVGARKRVPTLQCASIVEGDIRGISSKQLAARAGVKRGELDLVAGGPPCQPFSRAGKRESVETDDGQLFLEFVRVVDDLRPRWFLFENVKGLVLTKTEVVRELCRACGESSVIPFSVRQERLTGTTPKTRPCRCGGTRIIESSVEAGGSLDIIVSEFERVGYKCEWRVLEAADFGAPQFRERLFVVGTRDGESFNWPKPTHARPNSQGQQLGLWESGTDLPPWKTMWDCLWKRGHPNYGELDPERAVLWVKNVVRPHDEPVTWELRRPSPTIGAHQAAKLAVAPVGIPPEQLARQQWHTLGRRQGDTAPVPVEHTYLTDRELLQLQTFPSSWYLFGTRMQRAFQIGNAVPIVLARAMGRALLSS